MNRRAIAECDNFVRGGAADHEVSAGAAVQQVVAGVAGGEEVYRAPRQTAPNVVARISVLGLAIDVA